MSTTLNNAYIDAIAAQQIGANEQAAKLKKDAYKIGVDKSAQVMQAQADAAIEKVRADANEVYNTNAVNQYVREEQLAESMANAGLTNSGLNATQKTAILTSRGNADSRARATEQQAIRNIELQLMGDKAQSEMDMLNYNTQVDASLAQDNAKALADANTRYTDAVKASADERAKQISAATAAVKALNENKASDNDIVDVISKYADQYGLTETEIMTMCGNAGISYSYYKKLTPSKEDFINYLRTYNVSETGREALIPFLVNEGVLLKDTDEKYIEKLYTERILSQQTNAGIYGNRDIETWLSQGKISSNAATYMRALLSYNGLKYEESDYTETRKEKAKSDVLTYPERSSSYELYVDSFTNQFHDKDRDHKETLDTLVKYNVITPTDSNFIEQFYIDHYPPLKTHKYKTAIEKQIIMYYNAGEISENGKAFLCALFGI